MRVWDVDPSLLCRQHLLGEHRELHALANILDKLAAGGEPGYRHHPEVRRWIGHRGALRERHEAQVVEMERRGWTGHATPLAGRTGEDGVPEKINSLEEQRRLLQEKDCPCLLPGG